MIMEIISILMNQKDKIQRKIFKKQLKKGKILIDNN